MSDPTTFTWGRRRSVVLALTLAAVGGAQAPGDEDPLTAEQRAWLTAHLRLAPTADYGPAEFQDADGAHAGVSAEVVGRLEELLEIDFEVVWLSQEEMLRGTPDAMGADVVPLSAPTPSRREHWLFTRPYLEFPALVIVRRDGPEVHGMQDLAGREVGVVGGYAIAEFLRANHPAIEVKSYGDNRTGLGAVALGEVDAFLSDLPVALAHLEREGITNLRVACDTGFVYRMGLSVRADWPELLAILERGLELIGEDELRAMRERWIPAELEGWPLRALLGLCVAVGAALLGVLLWNASLHRRVAARTRALERELVARSDLEVQLTQAQKMEALGRMAGGLAHDFNNMLTVVRGYGETLAAALAEREPELAADAREIVGAADRAAQLTKQLLAFSRHQPLRLEPVDLGALLGESEAMLRQLVGEGVELTIEVAPDARWVHADAAQLQQVLMNLAVNAREAMSAGGQLALRTTPATPAADGRERLALSVRDTGCGMDAQVRDRIFDPFFTTKERGTGLGLSTVYAIVHRFGGTIEVESAPAQGTLFRVLLPRAEPAAQAPPAVEGATEPIGRCTVLLVEDDPEVRRMMRQALEPDGHRVVEVADGVEALERLQELSLTPDLVVSDVVMPRMGGPELARRITGRGRVRWLFTSGYVEDGGQSGLDLPAGAELLAKPFSLAELRERARRLLAGAR